MISNIFDLTYFGAGSVVNGTESYVNAADPAQIRFHDEPYRAIVSFVIMLHLFDGLASRTQLSQLDTAFFDLPAKSFFFGLAIQKLLLQLFLTLPLLFQSFGTLLTGSAGSFQIVLALAAAAASCFLLLWLYIKTL